MERRAMILALAALGPGLPRPANAEQGPEVAARVARREGSAILLRPGDERPLEAGDELRRGDRITTGPAAKVRLEFADGLVVVVGPGTEVGVDDYLRPAGGDGGSGLELVLDLLVGIVRLIGPAEAGPRRVQVRTPSAIASVRSTEWIVDATPAGATGVFVRVGTVEVAGRAGVGGSVVLEPGQGTDVRPGAAPTPPATWRPARRDDALARTAL
jgi:hypothetical protein